MPDQIANGLGQDRESSQRLQDEAREQLTHLLLAETRRWSALTPEDLAQLEAKLPLLNETLHEAGARQDQALILELADYAWNYVHLSGKWRLALLWVTAACEAAQASDDREPLGIWLFRRARLHEALGEPHMASELLHQALATEPPPAARGNILLHLGWLAQSELDDLESARDYLTGSETAFMLAHEAQGVARARRQQALLAVREGRVEPALTDLTNLRQSLAEEAKDRRTQRIAAAVELDLATLHLARQERKAAEDCLDRAAILIKATSDHSLRADVNLLLARLAAGRGHWRQAEAHCTARLTARQEDRISIGSQLSVDPDVDDRAGQAAVLIELGNLYLSRGKRGQRQAMLLFREARRAAGRVDAYDWAVANERLGAVMAERGQAAEAEARLRQAQERFELLRAPQEAAICALRRSRAATQSGAYLRAEGLCRQTIELCQGLDPTPVAVSAHELLAQIMERQRDWPQAAEHYAAAHALARELRQLGSSRLAAKAARCRRRSRRNAGGAGKGST